MLSLSRMKKEYLVFRYGDRLFAVATLEDTYPAVSEFLVLATDLGSASAAPGFMLQGKRRPAICLNFRGRPVCYFGVVRSSTSKARLWFKFEEQVVDVTRGELDAVGRNERGERLAVSALDRPPAVKPKPARPGMPRLNRTPKIYGGVRRPRWYR